MHMKPDKHQGGKKDEKIYVSRSATVQSFVLLSYTIHELRNQIISIRGVARILQSGGGGGGAGGREGGTRCQNEVTHQIFMSFLPPVVGCLLKTWLAGGGGHGHPRTPRLRP